MLSRILRWLGLGSGRSSTARNRRTARPRSATAHLFENKRAQDPQKTLQKAKQEDSFNPYNTGKFDRSASWERISKTQR